MNFQRQLGALQIGLREHSRPSLRRLRDMFKRRLRRGLRLDHLWPGGRSLRPDLVCIFPTYRCNLRCEMCFQRDEANQEIRGVVGERELSPEQWRAIIDKIARFAPTILWMGGEAMVYSHTVDLMVYAKEKGLKVLIITNGFFLAEAAERMVEAGVDVVTVSLDGFEGVHNALRGNPRSFARAVAGIQAVRAARQAKGRQLPIIIINHLLVRQNYRQVGPFVDWARELGADVVQLLGLMYLSPATLARHKAVLRDEFGISTTTMDPLDNSRFRTGLDAAWLQREIDRLMATSPAMPELRFCSIGLENYIEEHYGPDEGLPTPSQRCTSLWRRMVIQPNGQVTACYNQPEMIVGHALHEDLDAIWNGPAFRQFRQRIRRRLLPGCLRCGWLDYH